MPPLSSSCASLVVLLMVLAVLQWVSVVEAVAACPKFTRKPQDCYANAVPGRRRLDLTTAGHPLGDFGACYYQFVSKTKLERYVHEVYCMYTRHLLLALFSIRRMN